MNLEAVNQFIGTDWVYRDNDCWSVFCKASAAVFGREIAPVELPPVSDHAENARLFAETFPGDAWQRVADPLPGCAALFRNQRGNVVHIGLYIQDGRVLHCIGNTEGGGYTRYDSLRLLLRLFDSVEFYACLQ